ncbi:beta-glucosidase family protein [Haloarcula montana]|uniref:beta-glucosidase family protein n=1 Tax=Haloarcula montana TaxID=3111776 RepID=UPI002D774334|nr:glycoside hydrolase family 3 C-terminal domain-containing protein [Haloarcula sp. GH36]
MESSRDIDALVSDLTRSEKLSLVCGTVDPEGTATGYLAGVDRLDIPPFRLVDGPLGVRAEGKRATAFPASIATAASFDPDLGHDQGRAMAREATALGQDVLLAPGVNIVRVPQCGRNFEYLSEDPVLAGDVGAALVSGIESTGVLATVKHFVANNQESARTSVSAEVDERTLRELYLPPFRAAVDAGVGSVMTAYNRVNGSYMSDHAELVGDVLKDEWGFDGYVVSDWYGLATTVGAATAGLDLEMPGVALDTETSNDDGSLDEFDWPDGIPDATHAGLFGKPLSAAIDKGAVPPDRLDDMVRRVLGGMARTGLLGDGSVRADGALDTPAHRALATRVATRGTVLLENDGVLPLADGTDIAVIGPHVTEPKLGGGGSSETTPFEATTPAEGLSERADGTVTVAHGIPEIESVSLFDLLPFVEGGHDEGDWNDEDHDRSMDTAVEAAAAADVAVVFVRDTTTEGKDRDSLSLPGQQDELIEAVAAANDRTVVVVRSGGPVEMPWRDDVAAILEAWYPGQADGDAAAAVLYGDSDPGGRLPVTFAPAEDYPATDKRQFPGIDGSAHYDEGVFVGYRHFDRTDTAPTYPFGHGHSYATFEYRTATETDDGIEVTVENTSDRPGREVVQAYVRPPASPVERPPRELAAFESIELDAGESRSLSLSLDELAHSYYDPDDGWVVDDGPHTVEIGRSARDVQLTVEYDG